MTFKQKKVHGGKLLQLEKKAGKYKITGDFFAHPEESINELEKILSKNHSSEKKKEKIEKIFKENQIIGFETADLLSLHNEVENDQMETD